MLEFLAPVEHFGVRFDRAMTLFEFSALREPEATTFPQIGAWLRAKGVEFNEAPTPSMLWRGKMWPDLFIANQLDALRDTDFGLHPSGWELPVGPKSKWPDYDRLDAISITAHGLEFHHEFIEPLCRKITGRASSDIAAKFHRAAWLPLFWLGTLRARKSIPTKFFYPKEGYAGHVREKLLNEIRT